MSRPGAKRDRLAAPIVWPPLHGFDPARPEHSFATAMPLVHRKRLGQFFTPASIAELLAEWVCAGRPRSVLDPAVGPGILARAVLARAPGTGIVAVDVDGAALEAAQRALPIGANAEFVHHDFLTWEDERRFDGVILNPPYIRHHDIGYGLEVVGRIGRAAGIRLSGFTNAYGLFMIKACSHLAPGGRVAMIVPGEWANANFGAPIKHYLLANHLLKTLVYFSHAEQIFPGVLTTACLLLLENDARPDSIRAIHVDHAIEPEALRHLAFAPEDGVSGIRCGIPGGAVIRRFDGEQLRRQPKWDYVLGRVRPPAAPAGFVPLGVLATTMRGIATGANAFFHVGLAAARRHGLSDDHLQPCVGRGSGVRPPVFSRADLRALEASARPSRLVALTEPLSSAERAYLADGEARGLPRRYLLGRRAPWFRAEVRAPAPIWAGVFGRAGLRFVLNQSGAQTLNTFHVIYPRDGRSEFAAALAAALNSRIVAEAARALSRVYGGGLLKFEPRDLLGIPVPDLRALDAEWLGRLGGHLDDLDRVVRSGADETTARAALDAAVLAAGDAAVKSADSAAYHLPARGR